MTGLKEIRRRIRSIKKIQKITTAMYMVAASGLRKARERAENFRPYFENIRVLVSKTGENQILSRNPIFQEKAIKKGLYIVITGDQGLAGGYNINVIKEALEHMPYGERFFIAVGKKGSIFLRNRGYTLLEELNNNGREDEVSKHIGKKVLQLYSSGEMDAVYLAYTEFVTTLKQEPKVIRLLPVDIKEFMKNDGSEGEQEGYLFEPSPDEVLKGLIPLYLSSQIYGALLESKASELASRMTAMDSATDNARNLIDSLTLSYNRIRQGAITGEISEIVGGAEALKEGDSR
ncbi:ATP synthase gamma chain, sodium ion specific [Koleobacter methoxysyntrophicus]|uniref:ATP synthase gamma chain n=1 Tax=Koleobacter methoxysyntrophicus TaxID=2751313 RepID=A0A8A0RNB2_9FIRM|nr:ATP synthase F1 subunit gamma [Koleobacter methoxysyntrophicus]QSQ09090.1 ATP synthase gamma chain, sodium ion specific [Koleobacter methoxysyntrophicus]